MEQIFGIEDIFSIISIIFEFVQMKVQIEW